MPKWKKPAINGFEMALSVVSPNLAMRRYQSRCQLSAASFRPTDASRDDNRTRTGLGGTADRHLDHDTLYDVREISRDMERNSGLSSALLDRITENVIGPNGFDLQPATGNESLDDRLADDWLEILEKIDVTGEMHGWELFSLGYRTTHRDGDLVFKLDQKANKFEGGLLMIEGDRIFTPWRLQMREGFSMRQGFVRRKGRKVAVWVSNEVHQSEIFNTIHHNQGKFLKDGKWVQWMRRQRPSTRGWPTTSTIIREHDDLDDILLYERIALKLGAAQCYFIETDSAVEMRDVLTDEVDSSDTHVIHREDVHPGTINYVAKGHVPHQLQTNRPGDNFEPFVRMVNRHIGLPFGFPYELVTLDFSHVNFASSRQLLNQAWRHFRVEQVQLGRKISEIYRWWLNRQIDLGRYARGGVSRRNMLRHSWGYPGWPSPNPVQDAQAAEIGILNAFESRTNYNRTRGVAQDQIDAELKSELAGAKSLVIDSGPVNADEKLAFAARLADMTETAGEWLMQQTDSPVDMQDYLQTQRRAARLLRNGHPV